jgi:multicomponent Na+:H+ antiporter subunit E
MIIVFTAIWLILTEDITLWSVFIGVAASAFCVFLCRRHLPLTKIAGVNYARFTLYIFFLVGQIYVSAFSTMKLIFKGAKSEIVEVETRITNEFLRVMLANSITVVPGSVTLSLQGNKLTILMLRDKDADSQDIIMSAMLMKSKLENRLLMAQK